VMTGEVLETPVDVRLIFAGPFHSGLQVVRNDRLGNATEKTQGICAAGNQLAPLLALAGLYVGVVAAGKDGNEYFHGNKFTGLPIGDMQLIPREINEHLLAGYMVKLHRAFLHRVFTAVV